MSTLTVYDAQGNEYSPSGGATGTNQRIKEMALASMRVAIKPDSRQVTGYFRAKETPNSRAEQFYGEYTDRSTAEPLADFVSAVRTQIDEWNHTLAESDDSMSVFKALTNQRRATVPGSEKDMRILEELVGDRAVTAVGVSSASDAVGLLQEFADQHSVAIADSTNTDALSEFDIVIVTGRHQGIEPVGQTTGRWKEAKQSIKRELVSEEISSITESVRTLKRDFGMSSGEIQRKVSGLEASSSGSQSSKLGSASSGGGLKQTLLSPQVGKYIFIGAIILIVLIGGYFGATQFGILGSPPEISGEVVDENEEPIPNASVKIINPDGDINPANQNKTSRYTATTDNNGEYSLELENKEGTYTVEYGNDTYEGVEPGDSNIDFPRDQSESNSTESEEGSSGSLIPDWLPTGGGGGEGDESSGDDGSGENDESGGDDESADGGSTNETDSQSTEENVISYIQGNVTKEGGNNDGISGATVVVSKAVDDGENEEINETETDGTGFYRIEDVEIPLNEGENLKDVTLIFEYSADGYETQNKEKNLNLYTSPSDGFESSLSIPEQ